MRPLAADLRGGGEGGPGAPAAWPRLTKPKAYSSQGAQIVNCHISLSVSLLLALRSRFDIVDIFFSFVALGKIKANNIFFFRQRQVAILLM